MGLFKILKGLINEDDTSQKVRVEKPIKKPKPTLKKELKKNDIKQKKKPILKKEVKRKEVEKPIKKISENTKKEVKKVDSKKVTTSQKKEVKKEGELSVEKTTISFSTKPIKKKKLFEDEVTQVLDLDSMKLDMNLEIDRENNKIDEN